MANNSNKSNKSVYLVVVIFIVIIMLLCQPVIGVSTPNEIETQSTFNDIYKVRMIGFGVGGIVKGTWAAAYMALYGGYVVTGSLCSVLQSIALSSII
nr:1344_t:CDS:2 [Entrophospora candida]